MPSAGTEPGKSQIPLPVSAKGFDAFKTVYAALFILLLDGIYCGDKLRFILCVVLFQLVEHEDYVRPAPVLQVAAQQLLKLRSAFTALKISITAALRILPGILQGSPSARSSSRSCANPYLSNILCSFRNLQQICNRTFLPSAPARERSGFFPPARSGIQIHSIIAGYPRRMSTARRADTFPPTSDRSIRQQRV